jgi:hypothetical protein
LFPYARGPVYGNNPRNNPRIDLRSRGDQESNVEERKLLVKNP